MLDWIRVAKNTLLIKRTGAFKLYWFDPNTQTHVHLN